MAGDPLPGPVEMRRPALEWAMNHRGGYTGYDLKEYLAGLYKLTQEQLARTKEDGSPLFANYVDWVTAEFTDKHIHTGWDGRPHRNSDERYFLTRYGYSVAEGKAAWPTSRRKGEPNAKPDPRQLTEAQLELRRNGLPLPPETERQEREALMAQLQAMIAEWKEQQTGSSVGGPQQ
jgi:hypothetical protein